MKRTKCTKHDFQFFLSIGNWHWPHHWRCVADYWLLISLLVQHCKQMIWNQSRSSQLLFYYCAHESTNEWGKLKLIVPIEKWLQSMLFMALIDFKYRNRNFVGFSIKKMDVLWNNNQQICCIWEWFESIKNRTNVEWWDK